MATAKLAASCAIVYALTAPALGQTFDAQPLGKEWRCTARPNTQYEIGTVYEVVGNHEPRVFAKLVDEKITGFKISRGMADMGRVKMSASAGGRIAVGLKERVLKIAKATIGMKLEDTDVWDVQYNIVAYNVILGASVEAAREWIKKNAKSAEPGTRYYLVREALKASAIDYRASSALVADMGGEIAATKALNAEIVAGGATSSSYILSRQLKPPMWVCQLADLLTPEHNIVGGVTWDVKEGVNLDLSEPADYGTESISSN